MPLRLGTRSDSVTISIVSAVTSEAIAAPAVALPRSVQHECSASVCRRHSQSAAHTKLDVEHTSARLVQQCHRANDYTGFTTRTEETMLL